MEHQQAGHPEQGKVDIEELEGGCELWKVAAMNKDEKQIERGRWLWKFRAAN